MRSPTIGCLATSAAVRTFGAFIRQPPQAGSRLLRKSHSGTVRRTRQCATKAAARTPTRCPSRHPWKGRSHPSAQPTCAAESGGGLRCTSQSSPRSAWRETQSLRSSFGNLQNLGVLRPEAERWQPRTPVVLWHFGRVGGVPTEVPTDGTLIHVLQPHDAPPVLAEHVASLR